MTPEYIEFRIAQLEEYLGRGGYSSEAANKELRDMLNIIEDLKSKLEKSEIRENGRSLFG